MHIRILLTPTLHFLTPDPGKTTLNSYFLLFFSLTDGLSGGMHEKIELQKKTASVQCIVIKY